VVQVSQMRSESGSPVTGKRDQVPDLRQAEIRNPVPFILLGRHCQAFSHRDRREHVTGKGREKDWPAYPIGEVYAKSLTRCINSLCIECVRGFAVGERVCFSV
jgi:hypothetical protein